MSEFGHFATAGPGFHTDSWGAGPFLISVAGKTWRFEDSDQFGPTLIKRDGHQLKNSWPGERSPFWRAHRIWESQGRRLAEDGATCLWEETIIESGARP